MAVNGLCIVFLIMALVGASLGLSKCEDMTTTSMACESFCNNVHPSPDAKPQCLEFPINILSATEQAIACGCAEGPFPSGPLPTMVPSGFPCHMDQVNDCENMCINIGGSNTNQACIISPSGLMGPFGIICFCTHM